MSPGCHALPTGFGVVHTIGRYPPVGVPSPELAVHCGGMRKYQLCGVLLAAATLLSTVLTGSASADRPWSSLTLSVATAPHGAGATVRLYCHPAGGSHPDPKTACRAIKTAHGDFDNLPGAQTFVACSMEYPPVIASARGTW